MTEFRTSKEQTKVHGNNDFDSLENFRFSRRSSSSVSSSDISDGETSVNDVVMTRDNKEENENSSNLKRFRSKSDGFQSLSPSMEPFEVFPSLPDSVLEKMGLLGDEPRERLSEEELERKFTQLALAFSIDSRTITDRCERQRRYRDQTETNLNVEIERLVEKVARIQPLCVDAEKTELLTSVLAQVDTIIRAACLAAISAERYGAVQQEERLSESVSVMVNHVNLLKKQRDAARKHLQMTKRVLQETQSADSLVSKHKTQPNGKIPNKRRASIHTIIQTNDGLKPAHDFKKIARRTSEMMFKATSLSRSARPSRLELGVDLDKIKEGIVENGPVLTEGVAPEEGQNQICEEFEEEPEEKQTLKLRCTNAVKKKYEDLVESGCLHELFCIGTLLCFSLSIITFGNILIELEYEKHNTVPRESIWQLGTLWSDILMLITKTDN